MKPRIWFGSLIDLSRAIYSYLHDIYTPNPSSFPVHLVRPELVPFLFDSKDKGNGSLAMILKTATLVDREHDNGNKSTLKLRFAWKIPSF